MNNIVKGKKEWRAHVKRIKALAKDYQIVYGEIQKYKIDGRLIKVLND